MKDKVYVPPLPESLDELKRQIKSAIKTVDRDMLFCVYQEIDYSFDICHVTKGSHRAFMKNDKETACFS